MNTARQAGTLDSDVVLNQTVPTFQSQIWILGHQFTSWEISAAKCFQKTGMDVPVTSGFVHCDLSSLKAFMKRQIVADSVFPAYSMLGEARIVVLDEIIDLRLSDTFLRWSEDSIGNDLYVG